MPPLWRGGEIRRILTGWFLKVFFRSLIPLSAISFLLRASSEKDAAAIGAMNLDLLCQSLESLTKF